MKYFDVHTHYGLLRRDWNILDDWDHERIKVEKDSVKSADRAFEEFLIEKCKKLDMVVAVNGLAMNEVTSDIYEANDKVEKFFKKYPQHIIGMAYIDLDRHKPNDVDNFYERGFKGAKFHIPLKKYTDPSYMEFYERLEHYNMIALFHTGVVGGGDSWTRRPGHSSDNMNPILLEAIGWRFPKLKIIGGHLGTPYCLVACFIAKASSYRANNNISFDISGGREWEWGRPVLEGRYIGRYIPVSNVLFGLDISPDRYEEMIEVYEKVFDDLGLSQDDKDKIFYKNACKIFGIEPD